MKDIHSLSSIKRIGLLTSGGDAPGMNAAIRAVVLAAHHYHIDVIGFFHGYNGLICSDEQHDQTDEHQHQSKQLTLADVDNIIHRGGTLLKSARCPLMLKDSGVKSAAASLAAHNLDALIVIGGDGSFKGLLALQKYWPGKVIGIPGTIDNDLDGTDFTIGFSTAVNTGIEAVDKIRDTADAFERVFIVELMGRHSGHITFNVGIACAAEQVLSFENFSADESEAKLTQLANDIKSAQHNRHASYIIVLAENLWPGGAVELANELKRKAGVDCTACVLGHIQRGGSPVAKDRVLATKMGVSAVQALLSGQHGVMIAEQNGAISHIALEKAIAKGKFVSAQLVDAQQSILALAAQTHC